jgi:tetratricopeptide (TPR) repeat protein
MEGIVAEIAKIIEAPASGNEEKSENATVGVKGEEAVPPAPFPSVVDYGRLPDTPYLNLVGRDDELQTIDEVWAGKEVNILSIIAWGGAGKTALMNEWLKRLQAGNYRGADAVLGWSFYSQGTKERATSAEQFLNWALEKLQITVKSTSATAKGEALAEAMAARRALLILDGAEPLQHGPGGQEGELKDQGLRAFLRRFAAVPPVKAHGIVLVTSRLEIRDIRRWKGLRGSPGAAEMIDLARLSTDAGAALLRDNGVRGADRLLRATVEEFEGHALALSLLAGLLVRRHRGDIQRRDRIGSLLQTGDERGHGHAYRVMEAYETEWLRNEPVLLAIMYLVGLFDRPATAECLDALRRGPAIPGVTEPLVGMRSEAWADAVFVLRDVRLLDREDPRSPDTLDAHPLVREWFGERLGRANELGWCAAQGRIYEYLRDTTHEGEAPTLEDLAPLYQAIAHACRAGRHEEALEIYVSRICRRRGNRIEYYSKNALGAFGSDLAAISWFFKRPYEEPVTTLSQSVQGWVLGEAAAILLMQGRIAECVPAQRASLRIAEAIEDWGNAATRSSNLSDAELTVGDIGTAIISGERAVRYAERTENDFDRMSTLKTLAAALESAGDHERARQTFIEAEKFQAQIAPDFPILNSVAGYLYCDFLLTRRAWVEACDRAAEMSKWNPGKRSLLGIAFDTLALGRARLGSALERVHVRQSLFRATVEIHNIGQQIQRAVDGLQAAGAYGEMPRGLLARAVFRRSVGDWQDSVRDLSEIEEIAEPGSMRLQLCDMMLERARLAFARIEGYAPLNGLSDNSPPSPPAPDPNEAVRLQEDATVNLTQARTLINKCGYHKRDEELGELEAVLSGERKFAELLPRV